ncbi:MAG TPA: hypothetical protein PL193_16000 [Xanthobacteraceae bacterium]|nr:hypothetical protein [Xanthobacteraceae bacterium]
MRRMSLVLLLLAALPASVSHAASGVECFKAQCEVKGRTCVEAAYAAADSCTKAARQKSDAAPAAEKFNCLRSSLSPCAQIRNKEQAACLASVQTCYKTCEPFTGKNVNYWCVADKRNSATAAFCSATAGTASPFEQCAKAFDKTDELTGGMTCDSLQ